MQYYIIDDLRLPPKRTFHKGWTMERFPSLQEALARYRALPSRQAKSLGMTDGIHVLELARHVLIYPAETAWEDVQAARPELLPLWAEIPEATAAAEDCISALNLRYQLSGSVVTPVPSRDRLRRDLRDKYLWLSGESGPGNRAPAGCISLAPAETAGLFTPVEEDWISPGASLSGRWTHGTGRLYPTGDTALGIRRIDAPHIGTARKRGRTYRIQS